MATLHDQYTYLIISHLLCLRMGNAADKFVEKLKTDMMLCTKFFFNRVIYDIMWKNIVEPGRPQITIWHMHIACQIPKAKNTLSEYVIFIAFPLQRCFHKCASLSHTYSALSNLGPLIFEARVYCSLILNNMRY